MSIPSARRQKTVRDIMLLVRKEGAESVEENVNLRLFWLQYG